MATTAVAIRRALEAAVRAVAPGSRPIERFAVLDGDDDPQTMAVPSAVFRRFMVEYGKAAAGPYQGFADAETRKEFLVAVVYPVEGEYTRILDDVIEHDIHDLRIALNNFHIWRQNLADPSALLHAFVEEWEPRTERVDDRLILVVPVHVQFLESSS